MKRKVGMDTVPGLGRSIYALRPVATARHTGVRNKISLFNEGAIKPRASKPNGFKTSRTQI